MTQILNFWLLGPLQSQLVWYLPCALERFVRVRWYGLQGSGFESGEIGDVRDGFGRCRGLGLGCFPDLVCPKP